MTLLLAGITAGILQPDDGAADEAVADGQDHGRELGRLLLHAAACAVHGPRGRKHGEDLGGGHADKATP